MRVVTIINFKFARNNFNRTNSTLSRYYYSKWNYFRRRNGSSIKPIDSKFELHESNCSCERTYIIFPRWPHRPLCFCFSIRLLRFFNAEVKILHTIFGPARHLFCNCVDIYASFEINQNKTVVIQTAQYRAKGYRKHFHFRFLFFSLSVSPDCCRRIAKQQKHSAQMQMKLKVLWAAALLVGFTTFIPCKHTNSKKCALKISFDVIIAWHSLCETFPAGKTDKMHDILKIRIVH